jgi:hypothetical protein
MSQYVDLTRYFTRTQADNRYLMKPTPPAPPTGLALGAKSGSWIETTASGVDAYLIVQLTDPARPSWADPNRQYIDHYLFTANYPSGQVTGVALISVPWNSSGLYKVAPLPPGAQVTLTAQAVDYLSQVSAPSAPLTAVCDRDTIPPAAPSISAQAINAGCQITLAALNTEPDFDMYLLYRGEGYANGAWTVAPEMVMQFSTISVIDQAIPANASDYFYQVPR